MWAMFLGSSVGNSNKSFGNPWHRSFKAWYFKRILAYVNIWQHLNVLINMVYILDDIGLDFCLISCNVIVVINNKSKFPVRKIIICSLTDSIRQILSVWRYVDLRDFLKVYQHLAMTWGTFTGWEGYTSSSHPLVPPFHIKVHWSHNQFSCREQLLTQCV